MDSGTIIIADSGSTKTQWVIINKDKTNKQEIFTSGINPFFQTSDDILTSLKAEFIVEKAKAITVYFYGAGCANDEKNLIVKKALTDFFKTENIHIASDLLGAARSLLQHKSGIACILGTGSNSCYYNGNEILKNVSPLGFIIGDEGSGAVLGKKLIGDILKNQLPKRVKDLFFDVHKTSPQEIIHNIYKEPFPNRYLAQYTRFISANIDIKELEQLVINSFKEFIQRNLLQYDGIKDMDIYFTGSISQHFKPQLQIAMDEFELSIGSISQNPMDGLVKYHGE